MSEYTVNLNWDPEVSVWYATSDDIPGLVLESGSYGALIERIRFVAPEILELNGGKYDSTLPICFRTERRELAYS